MEDPALAVPGPSARAVPSVPNARQQKRRKLWSSNYVEEEGGSCSCSCSRSSRPVDYSNPFAIVNVIDELDDGRYGSVSREIKELINRKARLLHPYVMRFPQLATTPVNGKSNNIFHNDSVAGQKNNFIDLDDDDDDDVVTEVTPTPITLVIIDSDDEEEKMDHKPINPFQQVVLTPAAQIPLDIEVRHHSGSKRAGETLRLGGKAPSLAGEARRLTREVLYLEGDVKNEHGVYVGVEEEEEEEEEDSPTRVEDDGLGDIWNEMSLALECSKDVAQYPSSNDRMQVGDEDCEHSFVLKDDLGYVCRICGIIERGIETIIEVQFYKAKKSTRTYISNSHDAKDRDPSDKVGVELSQEDLMVTDISAHPLHMRQMKPHQVEGFNFLCSNLVGDSPGGCIMAHAPGSGKTFMIISFMQSFLAKYPHARPLVVLPKGILPTWKREFRTWQVEDIPLYDFYSVKADSRLQQLEVLKQWVEGKSILFLGYKQFSSIVCDNGNSEVAASCQEILLKRPSILILDEGHTPRNENTDVLQSLSKVQTPRKVVLSGTLYQNHVKEVFTILNLVRPKFLRLDTSRPIVRRIWSKLDRSGSKKQSNKANEEILCELVEHTIQKDPDFKRKATVIRDLREMTSKVLHYYKGDFLEELPGLVDFTVLLNLSDWQKREVEKLKKQNSKFRRTSLGSAVYLHPMLRRFSENSVITYETMDELLEKVDLEDGVKAKFFLNMLSLCDSAGEKLLVFSQYLTPLKFLERLAAKEKGWMNGREIFVISGESNADQREWSMERFNNSPDAKVFFGSIKACGEGISLVGASRIIILDVHLNPSVTRQAIGRAYRPGQKKKVYAYRLVAADSPEQADHSTCFRKEAIAKMWFEWNEFCGYQDFEVETVELNECDDRFLESPLLREDVRVLYKR